MKILILSMPRCYTKSLQQCISQTLAPDQLSAIRRNGQRVGHLGEILHFNECWELGIHLPTDRVMSRGPGRELQHHMPVFKTDGFHYIPCDEQQSVPLDQWFEALEVIRKSDKDCVAKFFPFKFDTPNFGVGSYSAERLLDHLLAVFDTVIPVLRMDVAARNVSQATAVKYGWDLTNAQTDAKLTYITQQEAALWWQREIQFRHQCVERGLNIVWSESLLGGGHTKILQDYGIECTQPFPNNVEYSRLRAQ